MSSEQALDAEALQNLIMSLYRERKIFQAFDMWDANVNKLLCVPNKHAKFEQIVMDMKAENATLRGMFLDIKERSKWETYEVYNNCSDMKSITYLYKEDPERSLFMVNIHGELPCHEAMTILRDAKACEALSENIQGVRNAVRRNDLNAMTFDMVLNSWHPSLQGQQLDVTVRLADCCEAEKCAVVFFTWKKQGASVSKINKRLPTMAFVFDSDQKRTRIYFSNDSSTRNKFKLQQFFDRNYFAYTMHRNVLRVIDMSRKLNILDCDSCETMQVAWKQGRDNKNDSIFFLWLHRVFPIKFT